MRKSRLVWFFACTVVVAGLAAPAGSPLLARPLSQTQPGCQTFNETKHTVCGRFLEYWKTNGGLAQQGYPISDGLQERSDTDGKTYFTQYFERAVFELHPENQWPYDVLLSLLGVFEYKTRYGVAGAPGQKVSTVPGARRFAETGHTVGGRFLTYWNTHGGLAQQGFPISDEFQERSALDGKTYTVQYFQRATFELHPENPPPYDVLLSQLGKFQYNRKHAAAAPTPRPPTATPVPGPPERVEIADVVRRNGMAFVVTRVDITPKGVAVNYTVTDESAGPISFVLADADQHLLGGASNEYGKFEPDRRIPVNLNNGQSFTGATGFHVDLKNRPEKAFTYRIDNLPGIGSVEVHIPVD